MTTKFLLLVPVFVLFSSLLTVAKAQVNVGDSLALVDLYDSTGGPHWKSNNNWLTKQPVSTWYGIDVINNRVNAIQLQYNNLTGTLPESIGNFSEVTLLNLYNNKLTGKLPSSIGNLANIVYLQLFYNRFEGKIPVSITNLKNLITLTFEHNRFTGNIPFAIGNLINLQSLSLADNPLTGGIPISIGNLSQLIYLDLSYDQLSDTLPSSMGNLASLSYANLSSNQLSGIIPVSFGKLTKNLTLYLNNNHLSAYTNDNPDKYFTVTLDVQDNNYTFAGLEYAVTHISNLFYSPQAQIHVHPYQNELAVSAGGTLTNNTYTWYKAETASPVKIVGDSTFLPSTSGQYYAHVTNSIVTGLTLYTDTIAYTLPLAKKEMNISLSPNPSKGMIGIYGLNEKSNANITIADMSGFVWLRAMSRQQSELKMNVSRLKAGNYLVNVNDGKTVKTVEMVKE